MTSSNIRMDQSKMLQMRYLGNTSSNKLITLSFNVILQISFIKGGTLSRYLRL